MLVYQFPIAFPNLLLGIDKMHTPALKGVSNLTISIFRITKPNPPSKKYSSRRIFLSAILKFCGLYFHLTRNAINVKVYIPKNNLVDNHLISDIYCYSIIHISIADGSDWVKLIISNVSGIPIYVQIKQQIVSAILSGELSDDDMLPSLRQVSKELKISVLTTTSIRN